MRRVGNFTLFFGAEDAFSNWPPCRFPITTFSSSVSSSS